ncbi:hypothetical protein [Bradyrhizobium sp. SZCCHNPS2010]|uniref:hypothetical protein n=1 Tax=Bradyrhizobium sp. SZCCHNPS2010 TaxID=3057333 RepID=UPI002915FEA8|nr:hypothetical protein [Bradyrhizobium sp. SZCCHNPS2010]
MEDYDLFHQMLLRMRPIGNDLAGFITRPPGGLGAAVQTQECMIRLEGTFQDFDDRFSALTTLVALSARMKDADDQQLVTGVLRIDVTGFLNSTSISLRMIDLTTQHSGCSQDGATLAIAQEMKRTFKDAHALAQTFSDRVFPNAAGRR